MSCNCAASKEIDQLYKQFGHRLYVPSEEKARHKLKFYLRNIAVYTIAVLSIPFLICYVIYKANTGEKRISISKFLNLKKVANV